MVNASAQSSSAGRSKTRLRVLGTSVTLMESLRRRAQADLGLTIQYEIRSGFEAQRQAVMEPDSFDIYDQWFHSIDFIWPTKALQAIDIGRITQWPKVNALPKTGRLNPDTSYGKGCNPASRLYVQVDGTLGLVPTQRISMLPLTHNVDSFVYLPAKIKRQLQDGPQSWCWLLSPHCQGQVALQADAAIGALDAAMALQASGEMHFADIGNLTLEEIDELIARLIAKKKAGQFRGFWDSCAQAVQLMVKERVAIQSNWAPAVLDYERAGLDFRLAWPQEGYRAWYGGCAISSQVSARVLDAAYDYLNWWLSGWPGAVMARQGCYIANPQTSRAWLTDAEWDYWYGGQPAAKDLPGIDGQRLIRRGQVRDGGAYAQRMGQIAVWNSVMDEHNYLVRKWSEFIRCKA